MSKIGCKIIKNITRPDQELVEAFRGIPVANLDDCMNRISGVDEHIRLMNHGFLAGPAFTVKVPEGDNLMFHKAMDMAKPGDVIVIDAGGDTRRAIFGELMVTYLRIRGIAGIVVDGSIRDSEEISGLKDFPVYCRGVVPNGPYKNGPGEINTTIVCGGRVVNPGDIVVGDRDGVLFIPPEEARLLLEKVKKFHANEEKILKTMREEKSYERPWVDKKLEEIGVEYV